MRSLASNAALTGFYFLCCWLLLDSASAAHAQHPGRTGESALEVQRAPRSVVLKPAPVRAGASAFSSALRETPLPSARLDTIPSDDPPGTPQQDRWLAPDKAKHLGSSFLVVLGGQYVFEKKAALARDPALALSLSAGAAVGLGKELYDWRLGPTRHFSAKDLAADALGLLLAAGVVVL